MPSDEGPHYYFRSGDTRLEFWAERGMISLVDENLAQDSSLSESGYHWRIPPSEFIKRAISAMITEPDKYPSKLQALRQMLANATTACKLAKQQGDPTDPSVIDSVVLHQRKRQIVMPGELPGFGPPLKLSPRGTSTGEILQRGVDCVPDFSIGQSQMLTPERAEKLRAPSRRRD